MTTPTPDGLLTDEQLKAVDERARKATRAPWLVSDGSAEGFDGSWDVSGDDFCGIASMATTAQAAKFPRDPEANAEFIAHAREDVPSLIREIRRLRSIVATHDLCHNLHGKVDARAFADGCADEQRKLYGCAPDADELKRLRAEIQAHDDHYAHHPHNACGWNFSVAAAAAEGGVGR